MPPTEPPGAEPASSTEDAKPSGPEIADAGRQLGTDLVEVEQPPAGESEQTTRSSPDDAEEAPSRVGGASLGSVFEGLEVDGERGPDLTHAVEFPRWALGGEPVPVPIPDRLETELGQVLPRAVSPHDEPGTVSLSLPDGAPPRTRLRLRGMGGIREGRAPGDLYLDVTLVDAARPGSLERVGSRGSAFPVGAAVGTLALVIAALVAWCGG